MERKTKKCGRRNKREREKIQENVDREREVERGENHQEKVLADKIRGNSRYGLSLR